MHRENWNISLKKQIGSQKLKCFLLPVWWNFLCECVSHSKFRGDWGAFRNRCHELDDLCFLFSFEYENKLEYIWHLFMYLHSNGICFVEWIDKGIGILNYRLNFRKLFRFEKLSTDVGLGDFNPLDEVKLMKNPWPYRHRRIKV